MSYITRIQKETNELLTILDNVHWNDRLKVPLNPNAFLSAHNVTPPPKKRIPVTVFLDMRHPDHLESVRAGAPTAEPTFEMRPPVKETAIFPYLYQNVHSSYRGKRHSTTKQLIMLDRCSSCHYISESCLAEIPAYMYKDLGFRSMVIDTLTGSTTIRCRHVQLQVQFGQSQWFVIEVNVVKCIMTAPLACKELGEKLLPLKETHRLQHSKLGPLTHCGYVPDKNVGMMLGTKFASQFLGAPFKNLYRDFPEMIVNKTPGGNVLNGSLQFKCKCTTHGVTQLSNEVKMIEKSFVTNGSVHNSKCKANESTQSFSNTANSEKLLQELFRVELLDQHSALDSDVKNEDHIFYKAISESCKFIKEENCYQVQLPFLAECEPTLYNNFNSAKQRFESMEKRLSEGLRKGTITQVAVDKINESITEHIESGKYVELPNQVDLANPQEVCNYLPIRLVFNPKSLSTPIRATLDASAPSGNREKGFGPSLNSCLATGMNTLPPQESCHLNFRRRKYGFGLDLSRFFLSILIKESHRKFQRFVFKKIGTKEKLKAYEIRTVCWGQSPSPQICSLVLKKHCGFLLDDAKVSESFKQAILSICDGKSVYADNILQSCDSIKEAQERIAHLENIFKKGGFNTGKYVGTHPEILRYLPKSKRSEENLVLFSSGDGYETYMTGNTRLLGEMFNFKTDQYEMGGFDQLFEKYSEIMSITKTDLASAMAQVAFSHLGFRAPYTLLAKALLQQVCMAESKEIAKLGPNEARPTVSQLWKRPLSPEYLNDFKQWISHLPDLNKLNLDRYLPTFDHPFPFKIVLFADAGSFSSCAVAYMVSYRPDTDKIVSNFIKASMKSKPLSLERMNINKPYTVPRQELMSLHLAMLLGLKLCEDLGVKPEDRCVLYGDSLVANTWAQSDLTKLSVWHTNKVRPIQESKIPIRYIYSELNPADCGTKMVKVERLNQSLWRHGPNFLTSPQSEWPKFKPERALDRKAAGFLDGLKRNAVEMSFFLDSQEHGVEQAMTMACKARVIEDPQAKPTPAESYQREFDVSTYAINADTSPKKDSENATSNPKRSKNSEKAKSTSAKPTFAIWEALMHENSNHLRQKLKLAHVLRFIQNCKIRVQIAKWKKQHKTTKEPTESQVPRFSYLQAVEEAESLIYHWHQAKCFPEELSDLLKQEKLKVPHQKTRVDKRSRIFPLNPKLYREGRGNYPIIRSEGRLQYGKTSYKQFPVILDPGTLDTKKVHEDNLAQKMVKDLAREVHCKRAHATSRELMQLLRKRNIHILRIRQFCLFTYRVCGSCQRHHTQPIAELMAPLPEELTGKYTNEHGQLEVMKHLMIDHMGPFRIGGSNPFQRSVSRASKKILKVHVLLILDLVSGYLTTWIVPSVNAYYTAMALRCHFNNFVQASTIACDNATGFKLIDSELSRYYADPKNQEALQREMADISPQLKFKFGAPASPHMQGAIERSVKSLKRALKLIHQKELFSYHTLQLSLNDICGVFNSRPLGVVRELSHRDEIHDLLLTPKGILFAETSSPDEDNFFDALEGVTKRAGLLNNAWNFRKHMARQFASKFINDFLPEKDTRTKWQGAEPKDIKIGSVVVFEKDASPSDRQMIKSLGGAYKPSPATWPIAMVKNKIMSEDGVCRAYQLQLPDSKIKYFSGVNQKKTKQVIKPPTLIVRSANRCRLVPVYDRFRDMMSQVDSFPFGQEDISKTRHHPMKTRSQNKEKTMATLDSIDVQNTFMGVTKIFDKNQKARMKRNQENDETLFYRPFLFYFTQWTQ